MNRVGARQTPAHRLVAEPGAFRRHRPAAVTPEPAHPDWMTWAQRAVHRHAAFHGRFLVPSDPHGCWTWLAGKAADGYGRVRWGGRAQWAHRLARMVAFGDAPEAVCHTCDNPPCVNPEHLRSGTLADNAAEMWAKGRARVQFSNALLDDGLEVAVAALRAIGPERGRVARIEALAARLGVSRRTLYRLLSPTETPKVYRRIHADGSRRVAA